MNETVKYKPDESGYLSQEDTKSYYSRIGFFCFFIGAISFGISLLAGYIVKIFFPWLPQNELWLSIFNYALSFVAIYCIATPIAFIVIKPLPKVRPIKEKMKLTHLLGALCICFSCMQVGSSFSNTIITIFETITGKTLVNPVEENLSTGSLWLSAICVGILFPILEELLFRRLLCSRLLPLGEKQAVIISAAIFGLIHGNLYQFAYAFLIGLVFGYIYVKTGKLIYTMIFHCIINLYGGVFAQLVLSKIPLDKLEEILDELMTNPNIFNDMDALWALLSPYALGLALYMIYAYVMMGLAFAGFIVLLINAIKKKITFEQGILQTPKEHAISNFFLTGGVAAAVGFIAFDFFFSLLY